MFDDAKRWETYSSVLSLKDIRLMYSSEAATASYDLATQQVILPVWDCLDEVSTQALASHEIGHAKFSDYTLESFNEFFQRYKDLFNVVEDARIERLMKKEFAGLNSIFRDGYSVLGRNGIFPLDGIEDAPLVERLNVFAKFGFMVEVPFKTKEESAFAYRILNLSTKADVIDLCEDILQYLKQKNEEQKDISEAIKGICRDESAKDKVELAPEEESDEESDEDEEGSFSGDDSYEIETSGSMEGENGEGENEEQDGDAQEEEDANGDLENELNDSRTRDFQKKIEQEFRKEKRAKSKEKPVVLDSKLILERNYAELDAKGIAMYKDSVKRAPNGRRQLIGLVERCASEAASLFSQKKSAVDNFAKRRVHFGRIDTKKLAKHSVSDAIFKTVEKLPKGKNHGVVLLLDFSISMSTYSTSSVQRCACLQAAILGRFCQIVGIPFSIMLFGCEMSSGWNRWESKRVVKIADSNFLDIDFILTLGELGKNRAIMVSDVEGRQYRLGLGGSTPTLEAMIVARKEVLSMRTKGIEKVAVIVATDGGYTDRVYFRETFADVQEMRRLLLDAKPFDVSDIHCFDKNRMGKIDDWGFELFAGYVKKETGASIIFSCIMAQYDMHSVYLSWEHMDKVENGSMCRHAVEPYLFKHAWLQKVPIASFDESKFLQEPCWSAKLPVKGLIDQYLMMNASNMEFNEGNQKDFKGLSELDIASKLCSHGKGIKAYKAFARAFVDFFS